MAEIRRRAELFRYGHPKVTLASRTVIVTDDGVATGATTQAALWAVQLEKPEKLIAALPVGPVVFYCLWTFPLCLFGEHKSCYQGLEGCPR